MAILNGFVIVVQLIVLLLPGFLTTLIRDALVVARDREAIDKVSESLIYSLIVNIIANVVLGSNVSPVSYDNTSGFIVNTIQMIVVLAISLAIGFAISLLINYDIVYWLLRSIRLTKKTSRISVWHDVFSNCSKKWLRVTLTDGTVIIGWPDCFSDDMEVREIFLADATVYEKDTTPRDVNGPGILLDGSQIKIIEFLN